MATQVAIFLSKQPRNGPHVSDLKAAADRYEGPDWFFGLLPTLFNCSCSGPHLKKKEMARSVCSCVSPLGSVGLISDVECLSGLFKALIAPSRFRARGSMGSHYASDGPIT